MRRSIFALGLKATLFALPVSFLGQTGEGALAQTTVKKAASLTVTGADTKSTYLFPLGVGQSVAIDADGYNTIAGGNGDGGDNGAVWMWRLTGQSPQSATWSAGSKFNSFNFEITPEEDQQLSGKKFIGSGVAMSADGRSALFTSQGVYTVNGTTRGGVAYEFVRDDAGGWSQKGTGMWIEGAPYGLPAPIAVAISGDGLTAIAGGTSYGASNGAVYYGSANGPGIVRVWTRPNRQTAFPMLPTASLYDATAWQAGSSLSLSRDGRTAIVGDGMVGVQVGGTWQNFWNGKARVWDLGANGWTLTQVLTDPDPSLFTESFGSSNAPVSEGGGAVSVSADGNTAVVGRIVWSRTCTTCAWQAKANLVTPTGNSVGGAAISGDGMIAVTGLPSNNQGAGAIQAWAFNPTSSTWSASGQEVAVTDGTVKRLGAKIALSHDGSTAIVGAPDFTTGNVGNVVLVRNLRSYDPASSSISNRMVENLPTNFTASFPLIKIPNEDATLVFAYGDARPYPRSTADDWSPGYNKGECAANSVGAGLSMGTRGENALRCRVSLERLTDLPVCRTVAFGNTSGDTVDWNKFNVKAGCAENEYVAGVSYNHGGRLLTGMNSILCCSNASKPHPHSNLNTVTFPPYSVNGVAVSGWKMMGNYENSAGKYGWPKDKKKWDTANWLLECGPGRYMVGVSHQPVWEQNGLVGSLNAIRCAGAPLPASP